MESKLENYQEETLNILYRMENESRDDKFSTVVNLPTGSGKTRIAVEFCNNVLKNGKGKILWLADRNELLSQAVGNFDKEVKVQALFDDSQSTVGNNIESRFSKEAEIIFSTVATMSKLYKDENKDDSFTNWIDNEKLYVIYDEVHHIGASQAFNLFTSLFVKGNGLKDETIKHFYEIHSFAIIGLTATVYRGDKFIDKFKAFFKDGYNKETDSLYHSTSLYGEYEGVDIQSIDEIRVSVVEIDDLIKGYKGKKPVLVQPQIIKVDEFKDGMPPRSKKPTKEDSESVKKEYLKNENAMEYLANRILAKKDSWGKTAVIVGTIEEAKTLCEKLGNVSLGWTSDKSMNSGSIIKQFREDDTGKILVTVHKFDEGVDVPELETLYLFEKTKSQILLRQRVGRVVRKAQDGKAKIARVIWQEYPEKEKYISDTEFADMLNSSYEFKEETTQELEEDYNDWLKNKSLQLPAIMYRKPLNAQFIDDFSLWMLFRAKEIFGSDVINSGDAIGFFYNKEEFADTDDVIFVRRVEYEGYRQFQRILQNDWNTILRFIDEQELSFEKYAELLDTTVEALLDDIKKVCFYQQDAVYNDVVGKKLSKRLFVRDAEIITFFRWFVSGELDYETISSGSRANNDNKYKQELFNIVSEENYEKQKLVCRTTDEKVTALRKKLEEAYKEKSVDQENNRLKEYTQLLSYGNKEVRDNYQEMLSKRLMMKAGITDVQPRIEIDKIDEKPVDALVQTKSVKRRSNVVISKRDWILYASALITVPNHIYITEDDIEEYEDAVMKNIVNNVTDDKKEQAVKECLLALGYADNDDIIRYQCKKIGYSLPKILQYVIYQKCYYVLSEKVNFVKNGILHPECVNKDELVELYSEILKNFEVISSQLSIDVVDDVIYDYRPYMKSLKYYQGIKPEFTCRMANDLIASSKKSYSCVNDGFGGSGAYTMNSFFIKMHPHHVYNDLGVMNTAFYRCLQDSIKKERFETEIQTIIECAFSAYDETSKINYLYEKYDSFIADSKEELTQKDKSLPAYYWDKSIEECEQCYEDEYNSRIEETEKVKSYKEVRLEDRLYFLNKKVDTDTETIRNIERYFHVFMLKLNPVYLAMVNKIDMKEVEKYGIDDVDLAVLFFLYNTLSHRHFYNNCTINHIAEMMCNYKKWIEYGVECFDNVEVKQKNALEFLQDANYNKSDVVWYLDIPYTATDSADYVPDGFETNDFIDALSNLSGDYIVSSRCNVCLPNEVKMELSKYSDDISEADVNGIMPEKYRKELNVFNFYSSFVDEASEPAKFLENLNVKQVDNKKDDEENMEKDTSLEVKHISPVKKAKYILIPYTKMSEEYFDKNGEIKKSVVENSSIINEDYVRRMLAYTHYSNIPVEVMITNIDIDLDRMPIQPTYNSNGKESDSVYVLPTFKTGIDSTQYVTEPAVIIVTYEKFMEILLSLLYRAEWEKYKAEENASDVASMFRNMFNF